MEASILDLRYKMKEVLKALDRNETVKILYHGKVKGTIYPCKKKSRKKIQDHPLFGIHSKDRKSVDAVMKDLRGGRHDAL